MHPSFASFHLALLALGLVLASAADIRGRRVPNWLNLVIAFTGLAARFQTGGFLSGAFGVAGLVVGLALLIYPFHRRWIGAGDVKLLGACGAWLGPWLVVYTGAVAALVGLFISLYYWLRAPAATRREIWTNLKFVWLVGHVPDIDARGFSHTPPYAPAIALGGIAVAVLFQLGLLARWQLIWGIGI